MNNLGSFSSSVRSGLYDEYTCAKRSPARDHDTDPGTDDAMAIILALEFSRVEVEA